jgi:hypothetical protein
MRAPEGTSPHTQLQFARALLRERIMGTVAERHVFRMFAGTPRDGLGSCDLNLLGLQTGPGM